MKWVGAVKVLEKQVGEWCGECVRGVAVIGGSVREGYGGGSEWIGEGG